MPRRREVPKREILPDPKFGNQNVSKFINVIMVSGKKSVAERIVYGAFEAIAAKTGKDRDKRAAEAETDHGMNHFFKINISFQAVFESGVVAGAAQQAEANYKHSGDSAAAESHLKGL